MRLKRGSQQVLLAAVAAVAAGISNPACAGATINMGDDKSVSVGFGLRESFTSAEDAAPNGSGRSQDFNLDSGRLYFGASLNKNIKGM
ncbi:MAG TPA: hypothetical protein VF481_19400, partial [Novosphingobium sp.]